LNNYLYAVAARSLNPDYGVRPRLRGRFEPARVLREPAIDPSHSFPRAAAKPYSERDRANAWETADRREVDRQPGDLVDPAPPLDRPRAITREVKVAAPTPDTVVERPSLLTIRASNIRPSLESPRENLHVDVRPVEKVVTVPDQAESEKTAPPQSQADNRLEPRREKLPSKAASFDHQGAEEAAEPTPTRRSLATNKPSLSREDEEDTRARLIVRRQPVSEPKAETIAIREEPTFNGPKRPQPSSPPSPREVVTSSDTSEPESSKLSPAFAPFQIKPLIESRPELMPLNQNHIQPRPTIHVTIGRLEVRAVQSSQPAAKPHEARQPVMNLDDYLRRRSQGDAR
jgi:hypothetical protein